MTCIGFPILIGGLFLFIAASQSIHIGGAEIGPLMGLGIMIIGLIVIIIPFRIAGTWNKVVGIVKSHESITIQEAAGKSGVKADKVSSIIYEAIASGDLHGTVKGDTFTRKKDGVTITTTQTAKVLVVCPFCGSKTEQGLASCQKCGADL